MTRDAILVETLGSHGRVHARDRVSFAADKRLVTIGRSAQADVILDDAYAAPLHASIELTPDGAILVSDLGTVNGIIVAGKRLKGAQQLAVPDGMLQIGRTRLRIRSTNEVPAPEKPDRAAALQDQRGAVWAAGAGGLACAAYVAYLGWIEAPRDVAASIVSMIVPALLLAGLWIALWALLSRVMQGEWRWIRHAAILFCVMAVFVLATTVLDVGWFVYALPRWESRDALMGAVAFAAALHLHLTHASSLSQRSAAVVAILLPAALAGSVLWMLSRDQERDVNYLGVTETIYPPALRLREAREVRAFFDRAALLRPAADRKRSKVPADDESDE